MEAKLSMYFPNGGVLSQAQADRISLELNKFREKLHRSFPRINLQCEIDTKGTIVPENEIMVYLIQMGLPTSSEQVEAVIWNNKKSYSIMAEITGWEVRRGDSVICCLKEVIIDDFALEHLFRPLPHNLGGPKSGEREWRALACKGNLFDKWPVQDVQFR